MLVKSKYVKKNYKWVLDHRNFLCVNIWKLSRSSPYSFHNLTMSITAWSNKRLHYFRILPLVNSYFHDFSTQSLHSNLSGEDYGGREGEREEEPTFHQWLKLKNFQYLYIKTSKTEFGII